MKTSHGFTLIEVMIVIVIIGVLAAIAIPNYSEYVRRNQLSEGPKELANLRAAMELYYQDNRSYMDGANNCGVAVPVNDYFTFNCNGTRTTFTWKASSRDTGHLDTDSFVYEINQDGGIATTKFDNAVVNKPCAMVSASTDCS